MLTSPAARTDGAEPIVIMRSGDGGVDVLAEDRTYVLPGASLRDLLFLGNRVLLTENGEPTGTAYAMPHRDRIAFRIGDAAHSISRSRLVRVVRGDVPADRLYRAGVS